MLYIIHTALSIFFIGCQDEFTFAKLGALYCHFHILLPISSTLDLLSTQQSSFVTFWELLNRRNINWGRWGCWPFAQYSWIIKSRLVLFEEHGPFNNTHSLSRFVFYNWWNMRDLMGNKIGVNCHTIKWEASLWDRVESNGNQLELYHPHLWVFITFYQHFISFVVIKLIWKLIRFIELTRWGPEIMPH